MDRHESFVYNIAEEVLDKLRSLARPEISSTWVFKSELKKIEDTLSSIKPVLLHAEEEQSNNFVGLRLSYWLRMLKEVCYDAGDVLDEFEFQAEKAQRKVRNLFSFSTQIQFKMKEIRLRLVEIEAEKAKFNLTERTEDRHVMKRERPETDFSVQHNSDLIIGRDHDKEQIVRHLMDPNFSIISIVGGGGLGKTTVAKLVYNDERVIRRFDLKMWVYVSQDCDDIKLLKEIINSAVDTDCGDLTRHQMGSLFKEHVHDKRFLLVLDDVWNSYPVQLNRSNFVIGAEGSKIIVTTRKEDVALSMHTTYLHRLEGLPLEVSLSLFMKCAFRKAEMHLHPNLIEIGKQLVKRCGGHPLSARILGSLLSSTTDERYWMSIKNSDLWDLEGMQTDFILPALTLSYNAMPSYLKQCFSYCSMFKMGYEIVDADLIQMWIAQGFIRPLDEKLELEDIGQTYFEELCSLSFFQIVERKPLYCTFKMHDLIHDLARSVAQDECHTAFNGRIANIHRKVQHVSFVQFSYENLWLMRESLFKLHNARTILFPVEAQVGQTSESSSVEICISRFKSLRVLDLSSSHFEVLPISIDNLKHLRYLNISSNRRIKNLPSSICKLLNLQSLRLGGCWELEELPRDMGNLINLRHLLLTTKQMFLPKEGIGALKSLRFLGFVGCGNLKSLGEGLQGLTALRTLLISACGNLESLPSSMKHLTALETLSIENCEKLILTEWEEDIQGLSLSLQTLLITRLPQLETLPQCLQGAKNTLQLISIRDCWDLKALPEWLQYLTSLQKLEVSLCPRLWALPEGLRCLIALKELKIEDCPELNRRCEERTGKDWPKIAHIPKIIRLERTSEMFRNHRRLLNKLLYLNQ